MRGKLMWFGHSGGLARAQLASRSPSALSRGGSAVELSNSYSHCVKFCTRLVHIVHCIHNDLRTVKDQHVGLCINLHAVQSKPFVFKSGYYCKCCFSSNRYVSELIWRNWELWTPKKWNRHSTKKLSMVYFYRHVLAIKSLQFHLWTWYFHVTHG